MESKEIFSMALNISLPWYVENVVMNLDSSKINGQIDIYINFKSGSKFKDETGIDCPIHDTIQKSWQHINFFEHRCIIHARVPRITTSTNNVKMVSVPWARSGSGFTLMFEAFGMLLIESEMPVLRAASIIKIQDTRLWRIFKYWVNKARLKDTQSDVVNLGIDETSIKKGHNYVTLAVDMDKRRVVYATPGKDKQTIKNIKEHLELKGCPSEQIKNICMDMSPSFISGKFEYFPNAHITFDKFHIMKIINEAMDSVRKYERKTHVELKGFKYLFLRNKDRLSNTDKETKSYFLNLYEDLGTAYRLKELFNDLWDFNSSEEAEGYLAYWCDLAEDSNIQPFKKVVNTIKGHWTGVVNFFQSRLNNGILEGINSKIQLAKKRARGYRNIENFINMIYFISGKLKFDYPLYLA